MAAAKVFSTVLLGLALVSAASATGVNIGVKPFLQGNHYVLNYQNSTSGMQRINLTVENPGSIGCRYQLEAVFRLGNRTETRYSALEPLWPGASQLLEVYYLPGNYTGEVETEVYSNYCEEREKVSNFTFRATGKTSAKRAVKTETLEAGPESAQVKLDVKEGVMVPEKAPSFWRPGSARIESGKAELTYNPPIFDKRRNLTYTVVNQTGEVLGTTKVRLKLEKSYWDRLEERLPKILSILLAFSVVLNSKFLLERAALPEKIKALKE